MIQKLKIYAKRYSKFTLAAIVGIIGGIIFEFLNQKLHWWEGDNIIDHYAGFWFALLWLIIYPGAFLIETYITHPQNYKTDQK